MNFEHHINPISIRFVEGVSHQLWSHLEYPEKFPAGKKQFLNVVKLIFIKFLDF